MMKKISLIIDWIMISIFLVIVILCVSMVLLRYIFSMSLIGGSELNRFLFIYSSCLGAAVLIGRNEHIKVDFVLNLMPNAIKKIILIINNLIIIILHSCLIYLSINWINKTGTILSDFFRVPMKYIQIGLPISFILAIFYAFNNIFDIISRKE